MGVLWFVVYRWENKGSERIGKTRGIISWCNTLFVCFLIRCIYYCFVIFVFVLHRSRTILYFFSFSISSYRLFFLRLLLLSFVKGFVLFCFFYHDILSERIPWEWTDELVGSSSFLLLLFKQDYVKMNDWLFDLSLGFFFSLSSADWWCLHFYLIVGVWFFFLQRKKGGIFIQDCWHGHVLWYLSGLVFKADVWSVELSQIEDK